MKAQLSLLALVFALVMPAQAAEIGDWRLGVQAGQVGLQGDVGNDDENSVGFGITGGTYLREDLVFEADFLSSSHTGVDHHQLSFGGNWYFGDYVAAYPNIAAGVSFVSNKIKSIDQTGEGFGVYLGGGFDFEITPRITTGIHLRYLKAFEGKTVIAGQEYTTVDDVAMVLLKIVYYFGSEQ